MKTFHLGALWLFLIAGGLNAQYDGRFERVLEAYIKEDNKTADKTTEIESHLAGPVLAQWMVSARWCRSF